MRPSHDLPKLIGPIEVSAWLNLSSRQVLRLARLEQIPHLKLPNGELLFEKSALAAWLDGIRAQNKEVASA